MRLPHQHGRGFRLAPPTRPAAVLDQPGRQTPLSGHLLHRTLAGRPGGRAMSGPATRLRTEAVVVERAALEVQYAGLAGARSDPTIIGALQLASDSLRYAAERLEPPPVASVRTMAEAVTLLGVWVVSVVATLLTV